jgi:hypothetical protein
VLRCILLAEILRGVMGEISSNDQTCSIDRGYVRSLVKEEQVFGLGLQMLPCFPGCNKCLVLYR